MKTFKFISLLVLGTVIFYSNNCNAQNTIIWQKIIPDMGTDDPVTFIQTSDGGFALVAEPSDNKKINEDKDSEMYRLIKFSPSGEVEWQSGFIGTDDDDIISVKETSDGGFIVGAIIDAGTEKKNEKQNAKIKVKRGVGFGDDYWVIKYDRKGNIEWQAFYGGEDDDELSDVIQTKDGGYLIYGESDSENENIVGSHGNGDIWVIKTDASGKKEWQKCYGGSKYEEPDYAVQTSDNNYYFAGETQSSNGQISNLIGLKDVWIFKTDLFGNLLWEKTLGSIYNDNLKASTLTNDGGIAVCGQTWHATKGYLENADTVYNWVSKLSISGAVEWNKRLDTNRNSFIISALPSYNGGVLVCGYTKILPVHKSKSYLDTIVYNYWLIDINNHGRTLTEKNLGTFNDAIGCTLIITKDNKYFLVGKIDATNQTGARNRNNLWMVKINR
jgi:hypothetical protein